MGGDDQQQAAMWSTSSPEKRVPQDPPRRPIRQHPAGIRTEPTRRLSMGHDVALARASFGALARGDTTMRWIASQIKGIMIIAGALTCTMVYAAISPQAALLSTFGESLQGPVAEIVVRNWGALITIIGAMLIYGAFNPAHRRLILVVAGLSKLVFILLVLVYGAHHLSRAGVAVAVDGVMIGLFAIYLVTTRDDTLSA